MITVLLEDSNGKELARLSESSNATYLIKDMNDVEYPLLSELSTVGPDVFASSKMEELIAELEKTMLRLTDPQQVAHVNDIIRLARECQANSGCTLLFTPFGAFLDNPIETYKLVEAKTIA